MAITEISPTDEVTEMHSTKTKTLTTAALALPLLVGCGQAAQSPQTADAASSPAASQSAGASSEASATPSTTTDSRTASAAPAEQSTAPTAAATTSAPAGSTPASPPNSGAAAPSLPAVDDPCAGVCTVTGRFQVQHPVYGAMEIVSYERVVHADTAPQGKQPSFAAYWNGKPANYETNPDATTLVSFGPAPVIGDQTWDIAGKTPVDRYGNLYLSSGRGVTVVSPTTTGYSSNGTIPEANVFPSYPHDPAGLQIDAAGEPTIIVKDMARGGAPTGKILEYGWSGTTFVQKK